MNQQKVVKRFLAVSAEYLELKSKTPIRRYLKEAHSSNTRTQS